MGVEDGLNQTNTQLEKLKNLPKQILDNIVIKPSKEEQDKSIKTIREVILKRVAPERREFYEKADIFFAGLWNGEIYYGVIDDDRKTVSGYFKSNGEFFANIKNARDRFWDSDKPLEPSDLAIKQRYDKILDSLGYIQKRDENGSLLLYKNEENGTKREVNEKTKEFFDTVMKSLEIENIVILKSILKRPEKGQNIGRFLDDFLFWQIISFKDIEILKQNDMINQEQFDYAKEKIKGFFFRLVYVGLVDREQLEDANRKNYIDTKTYEKCDHYLKTGKFLE